MEFLIVSRHAGAVEWLADRGITGDVMSQVGPDDVTGKHVVGNIPLHLACLAGQVIVILLIKSYFSTEKLSIIILYKNFNLLDDTFVVINNRKIF